VQSLSLTVATSSNWISKHDVFMSSDIEVATCICVRVWVCFIFLSLRQELVYIHV
jgi:hypothetical protein